MLHLYIAHDHADAWPLLLARPARPTTGSVHLEHVAMLPDEQARALHAELIRYGEALDQRPSNPPSLPRGSYGAKT